MSVHVTVGIDIFVMTFCLSFAYRATPGPGGYLPAGVPAPDHDGPVCSHAHAHAHAHGYTHASARVYTHAYAPGGYLLQEDLWPI